MNEPLHWLDDASDADEFERSILRAGLPADPPPSARDAVWSSVLGAVAAAPLAATAAGASTASANGVVASASKSAAVWFGVGKGFVVGLAIYGAASGATEGAARFTSTPVTRAPSAPAPSPRAPALASNRLEIERSAEPAMPPPSALAESSASNALRPAAASARPTATEPGSAAELGSVAAFPEPTSEPRPSQLQAEAQALRSARSELRAGKLGAAFATLEASRRQFSAPELYQEREALMIELLFRSGQGAAAHERAATFLERFPESPHAAAIRQFAGR